jgi:hypothetical protein
MTTTHADSIKNLIKEANALLFKARTPIPINQTIDHINEFGFTDSTHLNIITNLIHNQGARKFNGLADPSMICMKDYNPPRETNKPILQLINTNNCHWVLIKITQNEEPVLYDTLGRSTPNIPREVINYVDLIRPNTTNTIKLANTQQQAKTHSKAYPPPNEPTQLDCGLFAMAFITSLYHGTDPDNSNRPHHPHEFIQSKLRTHLINCLEKGENIKYSPHKKKQTPKGEQLRAHRKPKHYYQPQTTPNPRRRITATTQTINHTTIHITSQQKKSHLPTNPPFSKQ